MQEKTIYTTGIPPMDIGYLGENEVLQIKIDFTDWADSFGAGLMSLSFMRPGDTYSYPIALEQSGNIATWTVTNVEMSKSGRGYAQLSYTVGEQLKKSAVFPVNIKRSLEEGETPPEPFQSWLDEANEVLSTFENMEVDATSLPVGSPASASYDPESGVLTLGLPTGATGASISSITKTSTSGLVDTYTITMTDGCTFSFNVTNGQDGEVTEAYLEDYIKIEGDTIVIGEESE